MLKRDLKVLNNRDFGHISERVSRAKKQLEDLQIQFQVDHNNELLERDIKSQRQMTMRLLKWEKSFYSQQAKGIFIKLSDRSSKFFHSWVKRSKLRSRIMSIEREDGTFAINRAEIATEFLSFYTTLLGTTETTAPVQPDTIKAGPLLNQSDFNHLIQDVNDEEIKMPFLQLGRTNRQARMAIHLSFFYKSLVGCW